MERCNQSNKKTERDITSDLAEKQIEKYGKTAPVLSSWLENELPEGFTVFNVEPDSLNARRKLRTTNMVEFQNKELKNGQGVLEYPSTRNLCSGSPRRS